MPIRILLLGLVASLGLELPSETDVSRWTQAGSAWMHRMADRSDTAGEPKLDLAVVSDCPQTDEQFEIPPVVRVEDQTADRAFAGAASQMIAEMTTDLAMAHPEGSGQEDPSAAMAFEQIPSVGLPEGEEPGCIEILADLETPTEVASTDDAMEEDADEATASADRLSTAVRLTREAAQAWSAVLFPADDSVEPTR